MAYVHTAVSSGLVKRGFTHNVRTPAKLAQSSLTELPTKRMSQESHSFSSTILLRYSALPSKSYRVPRISLMTPDESNISSFAFTSSKLWNNGPRHSLII